MSVTPLPAPGPDTIRGRLLSRDHLADLPQPRPLIRDTLEQHSIVVTSGRRGTKKSFVVLDWACSIATGKPWQGREIVEPGPVLYIAAEGAHGLDQRVEAWEYAWRTKATDLSVLPLPVNLFKGGARYEQLLDVIREDAYRFVVIDTWARSTVGGRENDNSDSTQAFERVDAIRRLGPTVTVVAHTDSNDTKTRGATALEDNADTVYRIKDDDGLIRLWRAKRKDGPEPDEHLLELRVIDLKPAPDGEARSSGVIQIRSAEARGHGEPVSGRANDVMSIYSTHFADTGCTRKDLRDVCHEAGITSSGTFTRALHTLISSGHLHNTGTDKRPFYKPGATHA